MPLNINLIKGISWAGLLGILIACNDGRNNTGENEFYYFPSKNVYYEVGKEQYLFSLDSGKTWDSLQSMGQSIPPVLGEKQILHSSSYPIWANNETHIDSYKGRILNIVNEESLRPIENEPKPEFRRNQEVKKERKKPIKKFFEKLFGGKKKKSD